MSGRVRRRPICRTVACSGLEVSMTEVEAIHQLVGNLVAEASARLVGAAARVAGTPPAGHHRLTGEALPDLSRSCPFPSACRAR